jgi:hypothetical protein
VAASCVSLGVTHVTSGMVDEKRMVPGGPKNLYSVDRELDG